MFGYRSPLRSCKYVGGNGMATLGKWIFYCIGSVFLLGALGGSGGFGFIIVAIIALLLMKNKK